MSERLLRTFIAVTVPRQVITVRDMLATTIQSNKAKIRWVKNGRIHLTLKFLGHTPPGSVERINRVIEKVVSVHNGMEYEITGTGCFPTATRPRILWLGVKGDFNPVQALVNDLNKVLKPLGFPIENKEYIPHITIARVKYPPKRTPDITAFLNTVYEPIGLKINRIQFMSSELFPNGPVYSILGTHFLTPFEDLNEKGIMDKD